MDRYYIRNHLAYQEAVSAGDLETVKHLVKILNKHTLLRNCISSSIFNAFINDHHNVVEYVVQYAFTSINVNYLSICLLNPIDNYPASFIYKRHVAALTYFTSKNLINNTDDVALDVIDMLFKKHEFNTLNLLLCNSKRLKTLDGSHLEKSLTKILNYLPINSLICNKHFYDITVKVEI